MGRQSYRVQVEVVQVHKNGWGKGKIARVVPITGQMKKTAATKNDDDGDGPSSGDHVAIPKERLQDSKKGDQIICKVKTNNNPKTSRLQPWFVTFCEQNAKSLRLPSNGDLNPEELPRPRNAVAKLPPKPQWESWQDGEDALVLKLPSTEPGSHHPKLGISFACWKCGQHIIGGDHIFCIKNTCLWTDHEAVLKHTRNHRFLVDSKKDYNDVKKCFVQKVRCNKCKNILGTYYKEPYEDCNKDQRFPCYKLITAWERKKWKGNQPVFAMVMTGDKAKIELSIAELQVSSDWEIEKHFQAGGRMDKDTFERFEKAKAALMTQAQEEAEQRVKEAEQRAKAAQQAAQARAAELEQRALEAEALAAKKKAEADAAANRVKEVESQAAASIAAEKKTKEAVTRFVWECNVDGHWEEYPQHVSAILDAASQGDKAKVAKFTLNGHTYNVVFLADAKMVQKNLATRKERDVRRRKMVVQGGGLTMYQNSHVLWECELGDRWVQYPSEVAALLETNYQQSSIASFTIDNKSYEIDCQVVAKLEQVNIETGYRRSVRRRETNVAPANPSKLPESWSVNPQGSSCEYVPLAKDSTEWDMIEDKLMETLPSATLHEVLRVQNIPLWKYFTFQKGRVSELLDGGEPNVLQVWHGTRSNNPQNICSDEADGFMMQHSRSGMWGQGIYFAEKASYSDDYAHWETRTVQEIRTVAPAAQGNFISRLFGGATTSTAMTTTTVPVQKQTKTIILASLVAGDVINMSPDSSLRLCPTKPGEKTKRYHTVTGRTNGSKVYIVYENGRAYPEYLVTYS